jgi:hypothetical protein
MNDKKPIGRPRTETYINPMWKDIILEAGKEGKHISHFLLELGLSWDQHYAMLKRNTDYSKTIKEYTLLCEEWWYNKAWEAISDGSSNKFNQRLWTIIMKNKFRETWHDDKQVDITTGGEKLNGDNKIQIEVIKNTLDKNE